ncbi:MAG: hypothetical protein QXJ68_06095 [Methanocellales archaeon]
MLIAALSAVAGRREAAEISKDVTRESTSMTDARACITIYLLVILVKLLKRSSAIALNT